MGRAVKIDFVCPLQRTLYILFYRWSHDTWESTEIQKIMRDTTIEADASSDTRCTIDGLSIRSLVRCEKLLASWILVILPSPIPRAYWRLVNSIVQSITCGPSSRTQMTWFQIPPHTHVTKFKPSLRTDIWNDQWSHDHWNEVWARVEGALMHTSVVIGANYCFFLLYISSVKLLLTRILRLPTKVTFFKACFSIVFFHFCCFLFPEVEAMDCLNPTFFFTPNSRLAFTQKNNIF